MVTPVVTSPAVAAVVFPEPMFSGLTAEHGDAPPPFSGGGRGWFRQGVPRAGGAVPPCVVGSGPSPVALPKVSNLAGIWLRGANSLGVLSLPRSVQRALLDTLGPGASLPKFSHAAGFAQGIRSSKSHASGWSERSTSSTSTGRSSGIVTSNPRKRGSRSRSSN